MRKPSIGPVLLMLGLLVTFTVSQTSFYDSLICVRPPSGIVSWWPGDGHADDLSGLGNHGELQGSGVSYEAGKVGLAFSFDGTESVVIVPHSSSLDPTTEISVEAWVHVRNKWLTGEFLKHYTFTDESRGGGYWMGLFYLWWADAYYAGFGVTHGTSTDGWDALYTPHFPYNEWYHVVGTLNTTTGVQRVYMNGVMAAERTQAFGAIFYRQPEPVILGLLGLWGPNWDGLIDEVRIYDRALTPEEVLELYNANSAGVCKSISVNIDIKPGSYPNSINLGSQGNVLVAIFSTPEFDATTVDPTTVTLAGATVKIKGKGTPQASAEDVDGDGLLDLIVHVDTTALELTGEDTEAILEGETYGGQNIRGIDTVRIVQE